MKLCLILIAFAIACGASSLSAADASWWSAAEIEAGQPEDNYAPANLGQLKYVAKHAKAHLDANLTGGAGSAVNSLVAGFGPPPGGFTADQIAANYAPVNLGQLKAVAKPFYDRLLLAGYDTKANLIARGLPPTWAFDYPWNSATPKAENYAPANLGQLKLVFSFDLAGFDSDLDDLPDAWEMTHFGNLNSGAEDDPDRDGLSNAEEFASETDPLVVDGDGDLDTLPDPWEQSVVDADPFDSLTTIAQINPADNLDGDSLSNYDEWQHGLNPLDPSDALGRFEVLAGDEQVIAPEQIGSAPLTVKAFDFLDRAIVGRPVTVQVAKGAGLVRTTGGTVFAASTTATTDSLGVISIDLQASTLTAETNELVVSAPYSGSQVAIFHVTGWLGKWAFDTVDGTRSLDTSTFQRSAILYNTTLVTGKVQSAAHLDATLPSMTSIENSAETLELGGSSFSGLVWIKTSQTTEARIITQGYYDSTPGFALGIGVGSPGKLNLRIGQPDGDHVNLTTILTFNDGLWHRVAFVVDRATATARIYVDGAVQNVQAGDIPAGTSTTSIAVGASMKAGPGESLIIGRTFNIDDYFSGDLDEVQLYRGVLSPTEITNDATPVADTDADGLPDSWEQQIIGADPADAITSISGVLAGDDFDGDGISNGDEYTSGTSPVNYYNGRTPIVIIDDGDKQSGTVGTVLTRPLAIRVINSQGLPLINAPLFVQPSDSGAAVGSTNITLSGTLKLRTGNSTTIFVKP